MSGKGKIYRSVSICLFICAVSLLMYIFVYNIFLRNVYPIKYEKFVGEASVKYEIEPELIYAVIKNESNFCETAKSSAGAKGLMQITDDTFTWLQTYRNNPGMDSGYLMDPEINIDYGTMFISMLRKKYGSDDLVLSAYNAGMSTVERWLKDDRLSDNGEELKNIPYKETKWYVSKVQKSKGIYKMLYFS